MGCRAVRNQLDRLRRQELAPPERDQVEAHLKVCTGCRKELTRQERLAAVLSAGSPSSPVPDGFGDRLMALARQRQAGRRTVPWSRARIGWVSRSASIGRMAGRVAALAGGILIGVLMGQQTWQSAHPAIPRHAVQPDPVAVYDLDYLTDAPGGSLAQSYLSLTTTPSRNGI